MNIEDFKVGVEFSTDMKEYMYKVVRIDSARASLIYKDYGSQKPYDPNAGTTTDISPGTIRSYTLVALAPHTRTIITNRLLLL